jgi:hypothetical protein
MKKKFQSYLLLAVLMSSSLTIAQPGAVAASSSICNSVSCDNPQPSPFFDQSHDRPLDRSSSPVNVCSIFNNWKVEAVIQIVGGLLKVYWTYTLVPSVVCHLVG